MKNMLTNKQVILCHHKRTMSTKKAFSAHSCFLFATCQLFCFVLPFTMTSMMSPLQPGGFSKDNVDRGESVDSQFQTPVTSRMDQLVMNTILHNFYGHNSLLAISKVGKGFNYEDSGFKIVWSLFEHGHISDCIFVTKKSYQIRFNYILLQISEKLPGMPLVI